MTRSKILELTQTITQSSLKTRGKQMSGVGPIAAQYVEEAGKRHGIQASPRECTILSQRVL